MVCLAAPDSVGRRHRGLRMVPTVASPLVGVRKGLEEQRIRLRLGPLFVLKSREKKIEENMWE